MVTFGEMLAFVVYYIKEWVIKRRNRKNQKTTEGAIKVAQKFEKYYDGLNLEDTNTSMSRLGPE